MENLRDRIEKALESVRPYLKTDGGDVRLHAIHDDMTVDLEFLGNCVDCRMSDMTLKAGIEQAIKRIAPEVKAVNAINATA